jgi:hypothetical protein
VRFYTLNGKLVNTNISKYTVDWDRKCRSIIQFKVKQFLKPYWQGYLCYEELCCTGTLLKIDFLNLSLKIAIETMGVQHGTYNSFFHRGNPANYLKGIKNDLKKAQWLEKNGIKLIEIMEEEVPHLSRDFFKEKFDVLL